MPLPVEPVAFLAGVFRAAEGLAFSGEGVMYVTANRAVWRVSTAGDTVRLANVDRHLGVAASGARDVLVADFGPTNAFEHGPNEDGVLWHVTPEGNRTPVVRGIGDPNAVLVREDGTVLVSDDATDAIYIVGRDGSLGVFTRAVSYPNGMALSLDGSILYVAQTFTMLEPISFDGRLWAVPLDDGQPAGPARLAVDLGPGKGNDGLAVDERGRVYLAAARPGEVWRLDPSTGTVVLVAEGIPGVASLAFGQGRCDHESLYVTTLARGAGTIWRIPVGVRGAPLYR